MVLDGGSIANSSDIEHLARILRSGFFIRLHGGVTNEIIAAVSINGNELPMILPTQLWVKLFKELLSCLGDFPYLAGRINLGHMFVSIHAIRCQCSAVFRRVQS